MDVIDLLTADHNRVRGAIARFKAAQTDGDRSVLAATIIDQLQTHMVAEEMIFYRAVQGRTEDISSAVDEGLEEHHVATLLIEEIETLEPTSDPWVAKMTVLIESVEHHIDEEEEELFAAVRSSSSADWRRTLGQELDSEEVRLGAPSLAERLERTAADLQQLARDQEIPGRSAMRHDELAATVGLDGD